MQGEQIQQIIERAIAGDELALEMLIRQKADQILYTAVKLTGNYHDGEDAAQEVLIELHRHITQLRSPEAFHTWLHRIIVRKCARLRDRRQRHSHSGLDEEAEGVSEHRTEFLPQAFVESEERQGALLAAIDRLPQRYRICLLLYYYEQLDYRQIAQIMDTSVKEVDNLLYKSRKKIKRFLQGESVSGDSIFFGVAALPVLTQVLQADAARCITEQLTAQTIARAETALLAGGKTAGAAATGKSLSLGVKLVLGVTAAAAVTVGGVQVTQQVITYRSESMAAEAVQTIETLEDMLGQFLADELRAYARGGGWTIGWEDLLAQAGLTTVRAADTGEQTYVLYHIEKQDKQLMIITRTGPDGSTGTVFRLTERDERQPRALGLVDSYAVWEGGDN